MIPVGVFFGTQMTRRILINPNRTNAENRVYSQAVTTDMLYKVDFSNSAGDMSTSVSSATAENKGRHSMTLTTPTVSSNVVSFYASSDTSGDSVVKITATYADGKKEAQFIKLQITNPANKRYY